MILSIVVMLRQPLQGYIAETAGLRSLYLFGVAGTMMSFLVLLIFFPEIKEENKLKTNENESELNPAENWTEQIRQVLTSDYRRNFAGLLQAGIISQFFCVSFSPSIEIYLYEEIGWSFLFFGFYGFASSFLALILRVPFGKMMDKYHLKRIFFFAGPVSAGLTTLLMVFVRDPYHLAAIFLINSAIDTAHILAVRALWYDAIPLEVYSIGVSMRGMVYGFSAVAGSLLGAYLWASLGPASSFYIKFSAEITRGFAALYLIRDVKARTDKTTGDIGGLNI